MAEDEWMYELKNAEDADPNAALNEAWTLFVGGKIPEAKALLERAKEGPNLHRLAVLLESRADRGYSETVAFAY